MPNSNLSHQRVIIVGEGFLFDDAITQLLRKRTDLLISHTIFSDEVAFLNVIKRDQPNLILMCESGSLGAKQIIDSISIDPIAIGLYIFVIRLSNPMIDVYERPILIAGRIFYRQRSIAASTVNDFISILKESGGLITNSPADGCGWDGRVVL
jgi:hypothetical protein